MVDYRDKILSMAKLSPVLPVQVAKALNTNSLFASAMLSELVSKDLLKVSNIKIGSSPLYYIPELGGQLQAYADKLNAKDKKTYDLLKEKKVLREIDLDPLTRTSIKSIKDFARPLEVTFNNQKEIFWKWYLLPDAEAENIIKQMLNIEAPVQQEQKIQEQQPQQVQQGSTELIKEEKPKRVFHQKKLSEMPVKDIAKELPKELPKRVVQKKEKVMAEVVQEERSKPAEISASVIKEVVETSAPETDSSDIFLKQLLKFFQKNSIRVLEQKVIKKKADYEFIVELNSVVGSLTYFCKAKNKKRIGDGDISSAFVQGQLKKLPVLFVAPGELSRQAQVIAKELKGVAVKKLDG